MPEMRAHSSGGIVFVPTKEELEIQQMKKELKEGIEDINRLKEQLKVLIEEHGGNK